MLMIVSQYNFIFTCLPLLSHRENLLRNVYAKFGTKEEYERHKQHLVLRFFAERIEFERRTKTLDLIQKDKKRDPVLDPEIWNRLSRPKQLAEELVLPVLVTKKLTEREMIDLFGRLSQPKVISPRHEESVRDQKKDMSVSKKSKRTNL